MSAYRRWHYRLLRQTWKGIVAMGTVHLPGEFIVASVAPHADLEGPPAGHPERLCPQVPLSLLERRLMRELGRG